MRHFLTALLLLTACLRAGHAAQRITGTLIDRERNALAGGTVRCFVDDTAFVAGTTADAEGNFRLEVPPTDKVQRLLFNHLGYKELVVNLQPTREVSVRLGDVVMEKDIVQIHEVVVLAESRVRTEEKLMAYPTREELRHAHDGYSALAALMVPELTVNTADHAVRYANQEVLLCIDGREATQDEVRDLDAKYIRRVDLYPMGKPEFPQAGAVIDYIMRERDYAGSVGLYANQYLTHLGGDGRAATQYFQGTSEFAVALSGSYKHTTLRNNGDRVTAYDFPTGAVTRTDRFMPTDIDSPRLSGYLNYIYRHRSHDLYVSLRLNRSRSDTDRRSSLQYAAAPTLLTKQEHVHSASLNPGLKVQYTRTLPHSQRLRAELYGSLGDNDYDRWYEHRTDDGAVADAYRNRTDEQSHYASGKVNYTKTFPDKSSLNIDLGQDWTHTDNRNLRGGDAYDVSLRKSNTRANLTYNYGVRNRLNIQTRMAGHVAHVETGRHSTTNVFFTPSLRLSYIYKTHSYTLRGQASSVEADNANRTGDEFRNNEYEIIQGNPDLRDYMNYDLLFTHTWNINRWFTWMTYATFSLNTDMITRQCTYDAVRNALLWKMQNSGTAWQQHYEAAVQYNILPQRLYARAGLLYNYDKVTVRQTLHHRALYAMGHVVYQHKGLRARVGFLTQPEAISHQTGRISQYPVHTDMSASYSIDNWFFQVAYESPYRRELQEHIDLGIYRQDEAIRIPHQNDNIGTATVSYRFNYGKKKHRFDNSEVIDINQTTIAK